MDIKLVKQMWLHFYYQQNVAAGGQKISFVLVECLYTSLLLINSAPLWPMIPGVFLYIINSH